MKSGTSPNLAADHIKKRHCSRCPYLAFAFFALLLLHVAAALFHALVRRDGVFETMASVVIYDEVAPAAGKAGKLPEP